MPVGIVDDGRPLRHGIYPSVADCNSRKIHWFLSLFVLKVDVTGDGWNIHSGVGLADNIQGFLVHVWKRLEKVDEKVVEIRREIGLGFYLGTEAVANTCRLFDKEKICSSGPGIIVRKKRFVRASTAVASRMVRVCNGADL